MSPTTNAGLKTGLVRAAVLAGFAACAAAGCGSTPPRDQNYGTDLGADFVAPVVDAGGTDANGGSGGQVTGEAGAGGAGGAVTGGEAGAAGAGVTDLAGADGAAGAPATGS